jgi:hypothetical protein
MELTISKVENGYTVTKWDRSTVVVQDFDDEDAAFCALCGILSEQFGFMHDRYKSTNFTCSFTGKGSKAI